MVALVEGVRIGGRWREKWVRVEAWNGRLHREKKGWEEKGCLDLKTHLTSRKLVRCTETLCINV